MEHQSIRNKIAENVLCALLTDYEGCVNRFNFRSREYKDMTLEEFFAAIAVSYADALVNEMKKHP